MGDNMTIQLSHKIKDLKGRDIMTDDGLLTVGHAIATILISPRQDRIGDNLKLWTMAKRCYGEEEGIFDDADVELIKKAVKIDTLFSPLVLGQIELILREP
jgi:hypothetical protein